MAYVCTYFENLIQISQTESYIYVFKQYLLFRFQHNIIRISCYILINKVQHLFWMVYFFFFFFFWSKNIPPKAFHKCTKTSYQLFVDKNILSTSLEVKNNQKRETILFKSKQKLILMALWPHLTLSVMDSDFFFLAQKIVIKRWHRLVNCLKWY
jgi:hypothetical protein